MKIILALVGVLSAMPLVAAAQTGASHTTAPAAAQIAALHGAMPPGFDIYPEDPCGGVWAIDDPAGRMTVSVLRYNHLPLVHISYHDGTSGNAAVQRLAPHTMKFRGVGATYTMQCTADTALVDRVTLSGGQEVHQRLSARAADPLP